MDNIEQKSVPANDKSDSAAQNLLQDAFSTNSMARPDSQIVSPQLGAIDNSASNLPVMELNHHHGGVIIYPYGQPFQRPSSTFNCDQVQVHNGVITTTPFQYRG